MRISPLLISVLVLGVTAPVQAQQSGCWEHWATLGGPFADLQRSIELKDSTPSRSLAVHRAGRALLERCGGIRVGATNDTTAVVRPDIEYAILPAAALTEFNSEYPRPQLDGLRWGGRGMSTVMTAGAGGRWGPVSAAFVPVIAFHQNDDYTIRPVPTPGLSPFGRYFHAGRIDYPQRFGADAFWLVHPGQSFVRVDAYGAALGFSTENLRWGPSHRNPLLMSGAAPGFPHVFAGTSTPVNIGIGHLELEAVWGRLSESEYFDTIPDNDERLFAGLVVALSPGDIGLTLGVARSYLRYLPDGLGLVDQIFGPYTGVRDNPSGDAGADNQLLSIFFRWAHAGAGLEAYGEYAREDHWENARDLLMELDHSRAYTVGVEKVFTRSDSARMIRISAEATNLGMSQTWQSGRGGVNFYTHSQIRQGYTHRGQLLGAPIGPGSDAQYIGADYITREFLAGLYVERVRYDNDVYYRHFAYPLGYTGHDAEITVGLRGGGTLRGTLEGIQLVAGLAYSSRYYRDFVDMTPDAGPDTNIAVSLGASWRPSVGRNLP